MDASCLGESCTTLQPFCLGLWMHLPKLDGHIHLVVSRNTCEVFNLIAANILRDWDLCVELATSADLVTAQVNLAK